MKLYNPFKPHIVTDGKYYYVRKLTSIGWGFLDRRNPDDFWFVPRFISKYCNLDTKEDARSLIKKHYQLKQNPVYKFVEK